MSNCAPPLDPAIAIAVLAAGRSSRFGGAKLEASLAGKPLWHHACEAAEQAGFVARILIARPGSAPHLARAGWRVIEKPAAESGLASSLRHAVHAAAGATRLIIALADMPMIEAGHLRALALAQDLTFTAYPDGTRGVPAAIPRKHWKALEDLTGNQGLKAMPLTASAQTMAPTDPLSLLDIDTPDDLESAARILES